MGRPVAHPGSKLKVVFALIGKDKCPALEFFKTLSPRDKAKMHKLFQWLGDHGWINNKQKFKPIEGTRFFEFKDHQIRMPCFRSGDSMIITHGFFKKTGPIPPEHIERARRIHDEDAAYNH